MNVRLVRILKYLSILLIIASFIGCDSMTSSSDDSDSTGLWSDSGAVSSSLDLDSSSASGGDSISMGISRSAATTNEIYFRSSDIEFWAIDSVDDINGIFSVKYQDGSESTDVSDLLGYADGRSLEYCLGDESKSVVFTPYENYAATLGSGLNPNWDTYTASFNTSCDKINMARLDIGDGTVTFVIDGESRQVLNSQKESSYPYSLEQIEEAYTNGDIDSEQYESACEQYSNFSGFDANSIFFVDKAFLTEPVLATISTQNKIIAGEITATDLGVSEDDFSVVKAILSNKNEIDTETMIDVDGALFLPLTPVDLSSFDSATDTLTINIGWDIANAIHKANDVYFMDSRVNNTAFDFSVSITFE